jgi:hypothetical protein
MVGLMIDGARILSPGILKYALRALQAYTQPVVSTLNLHLGSQPQPEAIRGGYSEQVEDQLLQQIDWPKQGYKLFTIAALAGSSTNGWFLPILESNCIFLLRQMYDAVGGFEERFDVPGGGLANLDFYYRVCEHPLAEPIVLLGEGSFHQIHGGISTNNADAQSYKENIKDWMGQYKAIRGHDLKLTHRTPDYWGQLPTEMLPFINHSVHEWMKKVTPPISLETKMTSMQQFFMKVLPSAWAESMHTESQQWMVRCGSCGHERSVWELGGIRWKAGGNPRQLRVCPHCGQRNWHSLYRKT